MTETLISLTFSLPGLWARIYTLGLPADERAVRILKVDSDAFESRCAAEDERSPFAVLEGLVCLLASVWADMAWRAQRGHVLRIHAIRVGKPPFPGLVTGLLALAGAAAALRLSIFHDLDGFAHGAVVLALLAGPLLAVLGVLVARQSPITGFIALTAGSAALVVAAWTTIIAPVAAAAGYGVGLLWILESRYAYAIISDHGRSAAPTSPPHHSGNYLETTMETSDKLERWLSLGAVLVLVGLAGVFWHDASFPFDGTDDEIRDWYADGQELRTYGNFFAGLAGRLGLLVFFGSLYAALRRVEGGPGYLSTLMLVAVGVAAAIGMIATSMGSAVGMAYAYDDKFEAGGVDPQLVRMLSALGFGLAAMSAAALAVALGALATVALRTGRVMPRWLAWFTVAVAVLQLLNFPLFNMPYSLFVLWTLVVAGWRLFRSQSVTPPVAHGASPAPA